MNSLSARISVIALAAASVAACTTTGVGTGFSPNGAVGATFTWTEQGGTNGVMVANLSNGPVYQGPFFQITQESRIDDFGPLWNGWGAGFGPRWGRGWRGWGWWGPDDETITHYSGQVLANLQGPGGFMRCHFTLMSPSVGMAGGGIGQCQLPTGAIIHAQFPRQ